MTDLERWETTVGKAGNRGRQQRTLNRRRLLKATTGVAAGLSVAGCLDSYDTIAGSSDDDAAEPVTIGVLAPNPDSDYVGRSIVRAATVAVAELNDDGGINGRDVELAVGDTNGSPLEARRQYQRLVLEEGADVTVGIFASEALMGVIDDIAEQETIHLTSGAATTEASRLVNESYDQYKYHFRVGPINDYDLGRSQIDFMDDMAAEIGWESVALLAEDYSWTEEPWDIYQEHLAETGVDIVMEERYPPATDDFSDIYDRVEDADADVAFITAAHTGNEALADWAAPQRPFAFGGIHVPMQLPAYYEQARHPQTDAALAEYGVSYNSATAQSTTTSKTQDFINHYQEMFDGANPVYTGYHTYDGIKLFAEKAAEAGTVDSDDLVPELEAASFTGTTGTLEFYGQDHQAEGRAYGHTHDIVYGEDTQQPIYFQWQADETGEGTQEIIWPESEATAEYTDPDWL
ncbi:ABC transporter substrate-binding protein [Natronorubrum sulfidifaciens]|uniref:Extracellular ligand-binding receptor n=1 Tax=Natronorubrum sulfidifaciens JCM 14089 TaxID=1230460 RepID=L9W6R9_9EURY|nr:ABC transporter substrate-binding protein [Natronorubrum sulfidifaciens]ELY45169.1 extracellular ligand-binding receptor [Natronorubrum sulfidifaciens JCM 14089]